VKTPAIAVIEYNYERDGEIVIPAVRRQSGQLAQANQNGKLVFALQDSKCQMAVPRVSKAAASAWIRSAEGSCEWTKWSEASPGSVDDWHWTVAAPS